MFVCVCVCLWLNFKIYCSTFYNNDHMIIFTMTSARSSTAQWSDAHYIQWSDHVDQMYIIHNDQMLNIQWSDAQSSVNTDQCTMICSKTMMKKIKNQKVSTGYIIKQLLILLIKDNLHLIIWSKGYYQSHNKVYIDLDLIICSKGYD